MSFLQPLGGKKLILIGKYQFKQRQSYVCVDVKKGNDLSFPTVAILLETSDNIKREETVK